MKLTAAIDNAMPELVAIRRDLHAHPELGLEERRTSAFIARHLEALGYRVTTGLAKTGVVGTLTNGTGSRSISIRADIDALPIHEETGLGYASKTPGLMHACGHDGHTAMLLGAARALAERKNFDGTIHLIFQPAEENFGGAKIMVEEGLFDKFPCDAVFALHNEPNLPFGYFALREGPVMAAVDEARITVHGRGGHGAEPQETADPIICGTSIVMALQSIISRNIHPMDPAVVTVGAFHAGSASNIIPERAEIVVGIRSFDAAVRDELERRIRTIAGAQAESYGMRATVDYERSYDATFNHKAETDFVRDLAIRFAGADKVIDLARPYMGSEDFAYMLKERPGTYFFLGSRVKGEEKPLHHPGYDFNDDLLPIGAAFWTELAEAYLARP
ncbi:N-acetyl-L,L-diaminopimelate deacetylase [Sinorhizobium sojae CCBAU 05684]|uniref:N-acetyl-L,L-diaminopimelate deacetylase n=1 Tax=Sinorhizobium sojae CCBAU 05684 TaxID=716928 RepID=A0A249P7C8_9HYPH|nr:M20 aminoacylase family protein [Sinorhizobium sojae]ASY61642.1 N-acetyl-L,L-diaminopimelate deacetylase [Sinorhizobium sojae CCBAU 05684]